LLIAALAFRASRSGQDRTAALVEVSAPFSMALMNMAVCYGTLSYEYHTVSTLGMMPGLVLWVQKSQARPGLKALVCGAFAVFVVIAFRTYGFGSSLSPQTITALYIAAAVLFFGVASAVVTGLGGRAVPDSDGSGPRG
jgi:hypothetical protein